MKPENRITVGFVQISSNFPGALYLPYAAGCLQAYAEHNLTDPDHFIFLPPLCARISTKEAVAYLLPAEVVGFSTYIWNEQLTLEIARELKRTKPEVLIVFGGPQVPRSAEAYLRKNTFIDLACQGEGEQLFCAILENFKQKNWQNIPGISYLSKAGSFVPAQPNPQVKELSNFPSPYLSGVFDYFIQKYPDTKWLATWETNRGCPYSCTYCDFSAALSSKVYTRELEVLRQEFEWFARNQIDLVYCTDANFGVLPRDVKIVQFCADIRQKSGHPRAFMLESAKQITDSFWKIQEILQRSELAPYAVLSIQTLHEPTLSAIKRNNISLEEFQEIQRRCFRAGIPTLTDLILGLPEESYESFVQGVSILLDNGQSQHVQFNNLCILPNAEMGNREYQQRYGLQCREVTIVNQHGVKTEETAVAERQLLVIGSKSMPVADWIRARTFSWMTSLLFFDELLQIPLVMLREIGGIEYRQLIEFFTESPHLAKFPLLSRISTFFRERAQALTNGGPEYCYSAEWLGIWWPVNEYVLIDLFFSGELANFYAEVRAALKFFTDAEYLNDAILLAQAALKLPNQKEDLELTLSANIYQFYWGILSGKQIPLEHKPCRHIIRRSSETYDSATDWLRGVIWYQNKIGSYLHPILEDVPQGIYR